MAQFHKSPEHKHSEYSDHAYVSPIQNLKNLSSGGLHPKGEQNKSTNNLVSDQSMTDNLGSDNSRQFSAQGPHRYRITTSTGSMRSPGPHTRGGENRANVVYGEGKGYLDAFGAPSIRGITGSGEKETGGKTIESKYMKIDKERLYEEGIQLKRQLNALQDENTKLKTRNVHLEKEAVKFEKMFQEVSTNPNKKKNKQTAKSEGLDVPTLKQHIRDLKSELDDRDSELAGLKKKAKVTKIHELEVQLQALQDETLKLRAYAEAIMAKKTDNIIQEGERHLVKVQNAESIRLKKELDALQHANRTYELKCQDYQNQLVSKEEKFKRDQANSNRMIQNKERELVKLRSQLVGYTATASANADDKNKSVDKKGQIKKDVEKMTTENRNLKTNLEEKDSEIVKLEKQLKEIEAKIEIKPSSPKEFLLGKPEHQEHAHHPHIVTPKETKHELKEEEVKKVINDPSYQTKKSPREEPKKEQAHHAPAEKKEPKEVKVTKEVKEEKPAPKPVVEKKVSADDAKKIAYHINLSFRVKGVPFEAIEKLDWKKQAQSDGSLNRDQIAKVLKNEIFGLLEKEIAVLAQYLLQENNPKDNKTTDIDGVKATLTGLMGPLPYWDDEMKKKLHSSISKICTEYRETLTEALSLLCNGDYLTRKHLEEAAEAVEVPLNFAQLEYIITKLYERSGDANSLAIADLFEIFYVEEEKESPPAKAGKGGETKPKEADHKEKGKKNVAETKEKPAKETKKTISKEEDAYGIYEDDEFDDDDHKLSDEEDGAKYEPLFPPEGEEKHEKITERGEEEEDEEDDEEYKEDDYEEEENKEQVGKQKVETKSKQKEEEEEEEEYGDDQYEEEEEQEEEKPKSKTKEEVKKSSVSSVPKSSNREEPRKSKQLEEEEEDYEEPKPKKSVEIAKGKKKTEEDDYEEEYEEEFPEEDDA